MPVLHLGVNRREYLREYLWVLTQSNTQKENFTDEADIQLTLGIHLKSLIKDLSNPSKVNSNYYNKLFQISVHEHCEI